MIRVFGLSVVNAGLRLGPVDGHWGTGVTAVLGRDTDGPSLLLRALVGDLDPATGRVEVLGRDPRDSSEGCRVAFVGRRVAYPAALRVEEIWSLAGRVRGLDPQESLQRLEVAGLGAWRGRTMGRMTLAEQRVVALVEALTAPEVAVVVLEDPFFELDATDRVRVTTAVRRKAERGGCVFLSTDSARLALEVADTFLLLQEGVVQGQGPLSDLGRVGQPVGLRIAATPLRALAAALAAEPQVDSLWLQEDALEVWGNSSREVASAVARAAVHAAAEILAMEPLLGSLWDETGPDDPHGDRQDALAAASPKFNDGKALP